MYTITWLNLFQCGYDINTSYLCLLLKIECETKYYTQEPTYKYNTCKILLNSVIYIYIWHERMTVYPCMAYNEIYTGNSLNVCICLTTAYITDRSHWWEIFVTFVKCCPINAKSAWIRHLPSLQCTTGQSIMWIHVMHPY